MDGLLIRPDRPSDADAVRRVVEARLRRPRDPDLADLERRFSSLPD